MIALTGNTTSWGAVAMLNRKEKAFNLGFLVVWIVLSLAPPVAWLSENLRSAGLLPVIGNYAVFALVFAYAWWGVTSFRYTRPRAFWSAAFAAGVPIYLYAGFIAWSGWLSLTRLALPFMVLIFFIVNPRWGPTWTRCPRSAWNHLARRTIRPVTIIGISPTEYLLDVERSANGSPALRVQRLLLRPRRKLTVVHHNTALVWLWG
ncbi:hypothetical protein F5X71_27600 [Nocardia brasiliensis]|uniref:Uncharacterized protein n=1 Tax=Nocardia brasiliensis TaxID=37326 RepID=A0A6G9XXE5_NOCBR|nr:hypothetical protein [Nocardia brasiliensis]QIS05576.1 hypothetical protein F5X71_27600 [Nocardia brasiliensis]